MPALAARWEKLVGRSRRTAVTRHEAPEKVASKKLSGLGAVGASKPKLFDEAIIGNPQAAIDFITNILESSTEYSIIAKDLTGKIILWNEGAHRLYGYDPEEVIGKMNSSILHTVEDVAAGLPAKMMEEAIKCGKFEDTISRKRKNGEQFTARLVITPRRDTAGKVIGFLLISKDISDEIRMAQYARSLIEASLDPLVTISADGKITDVNEATTKVTGVPRDKLIGADFSNYFTEPEKAQEGYRQVFAKGMVTDYPLTIRHADGALTDVLYNASVYRDERGSVIGVFAAARDVTESRRAEQKFRTLIESAPDAMVLVSEDGTILLTNNQTERPVRLSER
jgi:PAS domain S-box-containing protein